MGLIIFPRTTDISLLALTSALRNPQIAVRVRWHPVSMKLVSYAGQQLVTTDDVADALVALAAEIAREGGSEALQIPIVVNGEEDCADLIVGVGNDLLVGPQASEGVDPDFSDEAEKLRNHRFFPKDTAHEIDDRDAIIDFDPDIDFNLDHRPA